jgi:hypothetical protein
MYFAVEIAGQEDEPCETLKVTSAGFEPREVMEVAVKPTGLPAWSLQGSRDFGVVEPHKFKDFWAIIHDTPNIGQICKYAP